MLKSQILLSFWQDFLELTDAKRGGLSFRPIKNFNLFRVCVIEIKINALTVKILMRILEPHVRNVQCCLPVYRTLTVLTHHINCGRSHEHERYQELRVIWLNLILLKPLFRTL